MNLSFLIDNQQLRPGFRNKLVSILAPSIVHFLTNPSAGALPSSCFGSPNISTFYDLSAFIFGM